MSDRTSKDIVRSYYEQLSQAQDTTRFPNSSDQTISTTPPRPMRRAALPRSRRICGGSGPRFPTSSCKSTVDLGDGKLHSLFVDPVFQGAGFGTELVERLEAHAIMAGLRELHLSASIAARRFYESRGYRFFAVEHRQNGMT